MAFFEVISQQSAAAPAAQIVQLRGEGGSGGFQAVLGQALGGPAGQAGTGRAGGARTGQDAATPTIAVLAGSEQGAGQAGVFAAVSQAQTGGAPGDLRQVPAVFQRLLGPQEEAAALQPTGQAEQSAAPQLLLLQGLSAGSGQTSGQAGPQAAQSAASQLQFVQIAPAAAQEGSGEAVPQAGVQAALPDGLENGLPAGPEAGQAGNGESLLKALQAEGDAELLPFGVLLKAGGEALAAGTAGSGGSGAQSAEPASAGIPQQAGPALRLVAGLLASAAGETPTGQPGPAQAGEALAGESLRAGQAGAETANQTGPGTTSAARGEGQPRPLQFLAAGGSAGSQGESAQIADSAGEEAGQAASRTTPGGRPGPPRQIATLFAQQPQTQTAAAASNPTAASADLDPATRNLAANMAAGREGARTKAGAGPALEATASGSGQSGTGGQNQPQSQLPFQIQNLQALTAKAPKTSANASGSSASFEALLGAAGGQSGAGAGTGAGGSGTAGAAGSTAASAGAPQTSSGASTPATQVGLSIGKAAANGQNRFTLRLEPPDLGRVEVKMEVSSEGNLRAMIRADSRETLDLLQRDVRSLERALADTGLKTDSGSLNFSLSQNGRDGNSGFGRDDTGRDGGAPKGEGSGDDAADEPDASADDIRFTARESDGLDITV